MDAFSWDRGESTRLVHREEEVVLIKDVECVAHGEMLLGVCEFVYAKMVNAIEQTSDEAYGHSHGKRRSV